MDSGFESRGLIFIDSGSVIPKINLIGADCIVIDRLCYIIRAILVSLVCVDFHRSLENSLYTNSINLCVLAKLVRFRRNDRYFPMNLNGVHNVSGGCCHFSLTM